MCTQCAIALKTLHTLRVYPVYCNNAKHYIIRVYTVCCVRSKLHYTLFVCTVCAVYTHTYTTRPSCVPSVLCALKTRHAICVYPVCYSSQNTTNPSCVTCVHSKHYTPFVCRLCAVFMKKVAPSSNVPSVLHALKYYMP